jgi:regulatory protein
MRSRQELADRLRRNGVPAEIVDELLVKLSQQGFVDDARFAQAWARGRLTLQPSGAIRLRHELMRKGVSREIIDRTVGAVMEEQGNSELELALAVLRNRGPRYSRLPREVATRRLHALLQRRGFSTDVIARVLRA